MPHDPNAIAELVRKMQEAVTGAAELACLPPDRIPQAIEPYRRKIAGLPARVSKILPVGVPEGVAMTEALTREYRAMFTTAIAIVKEGKGGIRSSKDPVGGAPFTYGPLPGGFELIGKLIRKGTAVSMKFGPEAWK